jgi:hypothetical protein
MAHTPETSEELAAWFAGQVPDDWFTAPPTVTVDREEIVVTGEIGTPTLDSEGERAVAEESRISAFREETRGRRIKIAERAEAMMRRKVSWVIRCGATEVPFTTLSAPVMTRLRMPERKVLDTLIGAGVARSRSDALAWCVRLVARNQEEWIDRLRDAISEVDRVRGEGPA